MTKLAMPRIDRKLLSKKNVVVASLKKIIKTENIIDHEDQTRPFETDALSAKGKAPPDNPVPAPLGTTLILS